MMGHSGPIDSIEFSSLGNRVLTFAQDGSGYRLWSTLELGEGIRFTPPYNMFIFKGDEVLFSPSGEVILDVADWRVLLWDAEDVRQLYLHEVAEGEAGIVTARICAQDERLLILTEDGRLSVRSIAEDAEVAVLESGGHVETGNSRSGASAGGPGVGRDFPLDDAGAIQSIEFCRGGDEFLVVRAGGSLALYDTASCDFRHEFRFGGHIQKVTVSADGNFACVSMGRSADGENLEYILLDLQKMELVSTLPGRMVNSAGQEALRQLVGFSPHGDSILFVDSEGRTAELWDPASGHEIATVPLSYVSAG